MKTQLGYHLAPRYTAGSPALVYDEALATRVAAEERDAHARVLTDAHARVLTGVYGEAEQQRAQALGLAGIVEERQTFDHHYTARDLITGTKRDSRLPTEAQMAAVRTWAGHHGRFWKQALRDAWARAGAGVPYYAPELQQLRNNNGHRWLDKAKL